METEKPAVSPAPTGRSNPAYDLWEEVLIAEDDTPLAAGPTEQTCCILHFVVMLCALAVAVYFVIDRKKRQEREFELRAALQDYSR